MDVLSVYISVHHLHAGANGGQRRQNPLELESQMVVSCHVGARNQTMVLRKNSHCLYLNC